MGQRSITEGGKMGLQRSGSVVQWAWVSFLILASVSAQAAQTPTEDKQAWTARMRKMAELVRTLQVDLADRSAAGEKDRNQRLAGHAAQLAKIAHEIPEAGHQARAADPDPTLHLLGASLSQEAERASRAFASGHPSYAKHLLGAVTGLCMGCHTQAPGREGSLISEKDATLQGLEPMDRARLLAATRRFDAAVGEYREILKTSAARSAAWEDALRSALAIEIRVKENPAAAAQLADQAVRSSQAVEGGAGASSLKVRAQAWKKGIAEWSAEKPLSESASPESILKSAEKWAKRGDAAQTYPMDQAGLVAYLRSAGLLHRYLRTRPEGERLAKALALLARVQIPLAELPGAELPQLYFSACVRVAPHTKVARECYQGYEAEVRAGFTGSAGTDIPEEEMQRLKQLRDLAQPDTGATTLKKRI